MIDVLVVEDHQMVADALRAYLEETPGFRVTGCATTAEAAISSADDHTPDVVLLDFHLADGSGPEVAATILRRQPSAAVVFLSADESHESMLAAAEAGACGYLSKSSRGAEIIDAVTRASTGEMLFSAAELGRLLALSRDLAARTDQRERIRHALTPRETEVLRLMAHGLNTIGLSETLGISFTTARAHVQSVLVKLGAHSRTEAVHVAHAHGLI